MVLTQGLANSLNKIKLKEELMDKNKELEIISKVDYLRETITDQDKLITAILKEIKKEIECEIAYFYLRDKKEKFIVIGKSLESNFVKTNKGVLTRLAEETIDDSKFKKFKAVNEDIATGLCIPLMISEGSPGALGIINAEITEYSTRILQTIAKQINYAISEDWEKKQIKNVFGRFVSPEIIETMLKNKDQDYLKTKKEEITVLFSDIRNFTQLSEKTSSERILEILNDHFNTMTEIVLKNKGMVDKFIGDAVMAVWGVPIYSESQAFRAIKAALEMQKAQKKLERKYAAEGLSFKIGIGINTGEAIAGNVGSNLKMNYTVIGDMVNVASRIADAAKPGQILISENTYRESRKSVRTIKLKPVEAKNKAYPIPVYEVVELKKEID
jgi:class 3 adenylate cyclase